MKFLSWRKRCDEGLKKKRLQMKPVVSALAIKAKIAQENAHYFFFQ